MASLNSRASVSASSVSATLERISSTGDDVSLILNQGGNIDTAIDLLRAAIANLTRISISIDAEKLVGSCQSILPKSQKTACLCSHTIIWELQISPNRVHLQISAIELEISPNELDISPFVRVHSLSMSRSQDLALLPRCCSIYLC